jgi:glycosyltransferase involved in cell wall biosynthesis
VTVAVPVRNEEGNLRRCLSLLGRFTEIVVIDSDSTDATKRVAQECGAVVVNFRWQGGYPKKRNWLLGNYTFRTPWILFLDADECITPEFEAELESAICDTESAGFWLNYRNVFLGRVLNHGVPQRKLALLRVGAGEYERVEDAFWTHLDMEVHEHVVLKGTAGHIRAPIIHNEQQSLHSLIAKHNDYSSWEANRFVAVRESGTPLHFTRRQSVKYRHLGKIWFASAYFLGEYFVRGGFLDGFPGLVHASLKASYFWSIYAKINAERMKVTDR